MVIDHIRNTELVENETRKFKKFWLTKTCIFVPGNQISLYSKIIDSIQI